MSPFMTITSQEKEQPRVDISKFFRKKTKKSEKLGPILLCKGTGVVKKKKALELTKRIRFKSRRQKLTE